jgi:hypothetical protein
MERRRLHFERRLAQFGQIEIDCVVGRRADHPFRLAREHSAWTGL